MCEIVAFTGGEGSPGRTFLAFNTAVTLGMMGFDVTVVEIGRSRAGICEYFGLAPLHSCQDFARGNSSLNETVIHCGENLDLLLQGASASPLNNNEVGRLFTMTSQLDKRDFVIVDAPEGVSESLLPVVLAATEIFAVVAPEQVAEFKAFRLIRELGKICSGKHINVILNRALIPEISEIMCNRLEHDFARVLGLNMDCAWFFQEDPLVQEAAAARLPLVTFAPGSETALRIVQLATAIEFARRERYQGKMRQILRNILFDLQSESSTEMKPDSKIDPSEIRFLQKIIMEALSSDLTPTNFRNVYDVIQEIMKASQAFVFDYDVADRSVNAFQKAHFAS
jgi:flagellar biosynthesis protein FlhG